MESKIFLFDTFIDNDTLLICLIDENGNKKFFNYKYASTFYIKASYKFLKNLSQKFKIPFFTCEKKDIYTQKTIKVYGIKVPIKNYFKIKNYLLSCENIEVFNIDLTPVTGFYFENNLFPLSEVNVSFSGNTLFKISGIDNPFKTNYIIPPLNIITISPVCKGNPKHSTWKGIEISANDTTLFFENMNDRVFFEAVAEIFIKNDPDLIVTIAGDPIIIPLLYEGAAKFGINIPLSRPYQKEKPIIKKSHNFFSYGKVVFRDRISYLKGRWHVDVNNSFFIKNSGIDGVIEVSRLTSIPFQESARISPGSSISAMELKTAFKNNYLIPSTKAYPERFKRAIDLIQTDKGGIFFLPPIGTFKNVAEIDFFSMYPNIINKFNISVETLNCKCCKDISNDIKIPGTNYYFCKKRKGIIPETIAPLIEKRKLYKKALKSSFNEIYNERQQAIKWMLVTCFGYLGYKNAKFGCVEAHEATTAAGRAILLEAKEIAENKGFKIIYGVTDSLYIFKEKAIREDYKKIAKEISMKTGFDISIEGIYKIIKFLPSAENKNKQVMNKFFGIFENNEIKVRGLMLRRRDTPLFIKDFQKKILENYNDKKQIKIIFNDFLKKLENREVSIDELVIKKRITKNINEYKNNNLHTIVALSLSNINPGESIEYIVTDNKSKIPTERATIKQFAQFYDITYYKNMLKKAYNEVL